MSFSKKMPIFASSSLAILILIACLSTASAASWQVAVGDSYSWEVTSCLWDSSWMGRKINIDVLNITDNGTHSLLKGHLRLEESDGTVGPVDADLILGSIPKDGNLSNAEFYTNGSNFIMPLIIPAPLGESFDVFEDIFIAMINESLDLMETELGIQVEGWNVTTTSTTMEFTLDLNGSFETDYGTLNAESATLSLEYDTNGVLRELQVWVKGSLASGPSYNIKIFQLTRSDVQPSEDILGYPMLSLILAIGISITIIALVLKKRHVH
ncbi:MAG: hypothetical protein ACTSWN_12730 [Promethearchaeota archaeon]